jgi:hypothetical protein
VIGQKYMTYFTFFVSFFSQNMAEKRAANFKLANKLLLFDLVLANKELVESKRTDAVSSKV